MTRITYCSIKKPAVVALAEARKLYPQFNFDSFYGDKNGVPICMAKLLMIYDGFMKDRCRIKWRCPLACGKIDSCDCKENCSPSDYGRCIYTKPEWDFRYFTIIPRGSDEWKSLMNKRTASERVNKRILNDYKLELIHARGKNALSGGVLFIQ